MSFVIRLFIAAMTLAAAVSAQPRPFDGERFHGRIAYSADGNHNDEDDWAASPVALAIFASFGVKDKLVHFDYNSILTETDPEWEQIHETSVVGAITRYGYDRSIFFDNQKALENSIESIARAIDNSTADDPLYFIVAGPMEVPFRGIQKSDPAKRKFVFVISHSRWNDGFSSNYQYSYNKRNVIPSGITWIQIADQNQYLSTSRFGRAALPEEWAPWLWMRDSSDENVRFLFARMQVTTRADCSDAGMAYFLMTGDEESEISKLRALFEDRQIPQPKSSRARVRIEAENFLTLDNFELDFSDDRALSHRLGVKQTKAGSSRIAAPFRQPYTAQRGIYAVSVRYFDGPGGSSRYSLLVNGSRKGEPWGASADDGMWQTHALANVEIRAGDEISVTAESDGEELPRVDYIQLDRRE